LEDSLKNESKESRERHERLIEALREKQTAVLDSKSDEITELKLKLADASDHQEKLRIERESLQKQLDKMLDQWRNFKETASQKYEQYSR